MKITSEFLLSLKNRRGQCLLLAVIPLTPLPPKFLWFSRLLRPSLAVFLPFPFPPPPLCSHLAASFLGWLVEGFLFDGSVCNG